MLQTQTIDTPAYDFSISKSPLLGEVKDLLGILVVPFYSVRCATKINSRPNVLVEDKIVNYAVSVPIEVTKGMVILYSAASLVEKLL